MMKRQLQSLLDACQFFQVKAILDIELPDINGLDLQRRIAEANHPPIVFITGHGDIPSSVRATKHGAVDFPTKPFSDGCNRDGDRPG